MTYFPPFHNLPLIGQRGKNNTTTYTQPIIAVLATLSLLFISGCGYHMRQMPALPFAELAMPERSTQLDSLPPNGASWTDVLQQELGTHAPTTHTVSGWKLVTLSDSQQRQIASLANDGTVREYRLYRRIKVQLQAPLGSSETFQAINLEVFRDLPYRETQRTAKELEESKLWLDMETEIGQRIARRIIWQTDKKNVLP